MTHINFRLKMSISTKCLLGFWMRLHWIYTSNQERTVILTVSWLPIQNAIYLSCYLDLLLIYQCFILFSLPIMFIANANEKWYSNLEKSLVVSYKVKHASIIKIQWFCSYLFNKLKSMQKSVSECFYRIFVDNRQNLEVTKEVATYEWIYTMYIHTMGYYLVIKGIKSG